jgi:hypothetical protein
MAFIRRLAKHGYSIIGILGFLVLPLLLLKGGVWLIQHFGEALGSIAGGLVTFLLLLAPLVFVSRLRIITGNVFYVTSVVLGGLLWLYYLGVTYSMWGIVGAVIALCTFSAILLPASLAILFNGSYAFPERLLDVLALAVALGLVYGIRIFGFWIITKFNSRGFRYRFLRYSSAIIIGFLAGYLVPAPLFAAIDRVFTGGALIAVGSSAPLNWLVVLYMVAIGTTTGFIAGVMAEERGRLIAGVSQIAPLLLMVLVSVAMNRNFLTGEGQDRAATWVWIGMVPAIISGHYGQKYIGNLSATRRLGNALAEVVLGAYSFGSRFTMHTRLGLPTMGLAGRTKEQQMFDREFMSLILSRIGLAVEMIDVDLKFGDGAASERYVQVIKEINSVIVDRVHKVCLKEERSYLHDCFSRYWPPADAVSHDFDLIQYEVNFFSEALAANGIAVDRDLLLANIGRCCLNMEPQVYRLVEAFGPAIREYCRATAS